MYLRLILLMGLVSLFADWLYESMRAVAPQYLYYLGASAFVVGLVFGLGDALGYAVRLVTGPLADRRGGYWLETFLGYSLQVAAVAGLIFTSHYWAAAALIFLERFSKALRTPARDVIIASAGGERSRGRAFGVHASLDQIGAVLGTAMATFLLFAGFTPRDVFAVALAPGVAALLVLYIAYRHRVVVVRPVARSVDFTRGTFVFGVSQFLLGLSVIHISLFMYRVSEVPWLAALLYMVAMVGEIPASLMLGSLYDRYVKVLLVAPVLSVVLALAFYVGSLLALFAAAVVYSVVASYVDVVAKAHASRLGGATSIGLAGAMWGIGLAAGGALYGYMWDVGAVEAVVAVSLVAAVSVFVALWATTRIS